MKKLRSYSSVWKVEQVIYSFGDAKLPTPVTVTQLLWLAVSGVLVFMFRKVPPLVLIHNPLIFVRYSVRCDVVYEQKDL